MNLRLLSENKDFRLIWISQVISQIGTRMFQLATMWWIVSSVNNASGWWVGIYLAGCSLPALLLAKKLGQWIDLKGSRFILLRADFLGIVLSFFLAVVLFSNWLPSHILWFLLPLGWLLAVCQALIEPSLNKAVPELVTTDKLESALAFMSSTTTMASFAGAVIGAFAIENLGLAGIALLNGMTFVVSLICDRIIGFKEPSTDVSETTDQEQPLLTGWQVLNKHPFTKKTLFGFAFCNFFCTPTLLIIPLYVKFVLDGPAWQLGLIESCVWLGFLFGAFAAPSLPGKNKPYCFGSFAMAILGLGLALPGVFKFAWFYGASLFVACFVLGAMNVRFVHFFHSQVAESEKGRFFAVFSAIIGSVVPLGFTLFSFLLGTLSVPALCGIQGAGVLVASSFFLFLHWKSREILVTNIQQEDQEIAFS